MFRKQDFRDAFFAIIKLNMDIGISEESLWEELFHQKNKGLISDDEYMELEEFILGL